MWCVVADGSFTSVAGSSWSIVSMTPFEPEMIPSVELIGSDGQRSSGVSGGDANAGNVAYVFQMGRSPGPRGSTRSTRRSTTSCRDG